MEKLVLPDLPDLTEKFPVLNRLFDDEKARQDLTLGIQNVVVYKLSALEDGKVSLLDFDRSPVQSLGDSLSQDCLYGSYHEDETLYDAKQRNNVEGPFDYLRVHFATGIRGMNGISHRMTIDFGENDEGLTVGGVHVASFSYDDEPLCVFWSETGDPNLVSAFVDVALDRTLTYETLGSFYAKHGFVDDSALD